MAAAKRFEDLFCWQEGKKLVNLIYQFTRRQSFRDPSLQDQIQRAAVSIISNIAEGFERGTKQEFIYFLYITKGSCAEVRSQLYIALDQKFITQNDFQNTSDLARRVSAMIYKMIESLKSSKYQGLKYKRKKEISWEEFMNQNAPEALQKLKSQGLA